MVQRPNQVALHRVRSPNAGVEPAAMQKSHGLSPEKTARRNGISPLHALRKRILAL